MTNTGGRISTTKYPRYSGINPRAVELPWDDETAVEQNKGDEMNEFHHQHHTEKTQAVACGSA